ISTAFGTTTANTFSALNTFNGGVTTNALTIGSLNGLIAGNNGSTYAISTTSLNASITGSAGSVANAITFNNSGSGASSGTTYNGSGAQTISYNTIGAQPAGSYDTFAYPFLASATSSTLTFGGGLVSNGSTTIAGLASGLVGNNNGLLYGFASSSLFGFTPASNATTITINGTANQL